MPRKENVLKLKIRWHEIQIAKIMKEVYIFGVDKILLRHISKHERAIKRLKDGESKKNSGT